jgi:hypothetical protein
MVSAEVRATASSAHDDHQGHDNRCASSFFAMANLCLTPSFASSELVIGYHAFNHVP